jgi:hypothetical protein
LAVKYLLKKLSSGDNHKGLAEETDDHEEYVQAYLGLSTLAQSLRNALATNDA